MMITFARIFALSPACEPEIAAGVAPWLELFAPSYGVNTPLRVAHLMGQLAFESADFTRLEENLNYTTAMRIALVWRHLRTRAKDLVNNPEALGNAAYALRLGNGDEASGDGWRFRGRGLIQLTGRGNYEKACDTTAIDLIKRPELAAHPEVASVIALAFWKWRGCNELADHDDVDGVTRFINGEAMCGIVSRSEFVKRAKEIFIEEEGVSK